MADEFHNVDVSHAPPPSGTQSGSSGGGGGGGGEDEGGSLWSSQVMYHIYLLLFSGILVFGDAASILSRGGGAAVGGDGFVGYAVAVGVITFFSALILGALLYFDSASRTLLMVFGIWLFIWNVVGAAVLTFGNPFSNVGATPNGYFGIWVSVLISAVLLAQVMRPELASSKRLQYNRALIHFAKSKYKLQLWAIIGVCSIIIWVVGAIQCSKASSCSGSNGFGVAFGVISMLFAIIFWGLDRMVRGSTSWLPYLVIFNAMWWVASFLALTFNQNTAYGALGNGYFGFIVGAFCAVNIAAVYRTDTNAGEWEGDTEQDNVEV